MVTAFRFAVAEQRVREFSIAIEHERRWHALEPELFGELALGVVEHFESDGHFALEFFRVGAIGIDIDTDDDEALRTVAGPQLVEPGNGLTTWLAHEAQKSTTTTWPR